MAARARAHECCSFLNFLRRETIVNTLYEHPFFHFDVSVALENQNFSETKASEVVIDVSRGDSPRDAETRMPVCQGVGRMIYVRLIGLPINSFLRLLQFSLSKTAATCAI